MAPVRSCALLGSELEVQIMVPSGEPMTWMFIPCVRCLAE